MPPATEPLTAKEDFQKARDYVVPNLEMNRPQDLTYKCLQHTPDVMDAARLAGKEGCSGRNKLAASCEVARETLPQPVKTVNSSWPPSFRKRRSAPARRFCVMPIYIA